MAKTYYDPQNGQHYYQGNKRGAFYVDAPISQKDESYINQYNYTPFHSQAYNNYLHYMEELRRQEEEERRRQQEMQERAAVATQPSLTGRITAGAAQNPNDYLNRNTPSNDIDFRSIDAARTQRAVDRIKNETDQATNPLYWIGAKKPKDLGEQKNDIPVEKYIPESVKANDKNTLQQLDQKINKGRTLTPNEEIQYSEAKLRQYYKQNPGLEKLITEYNDYHSASNALLNSDEDDMKKNMYMTKALAKSQDVEKRIKELTGWNDDELAGVLQYARRIQDYKDTAADTKQYEIDTNAAVGEQAKKALENTQYSLKNNGGVENFIAWGSNRFDPRPKGFGANTDNGLYRKVNNSNTAIAETSKAIKDDATKIVSAALGEEKGKVAADLAGRAYEAGVSALDSELTKIPGLIVTAATGSKKLGEVVGLAPYYFKSYNSGYMEARNKGATEEEAWGRGVMSGLIEVGTELVGMDNFIDNLMGKNASKSFIKNLIKQMSAEGLEEGLSDILNEFTDTLLYSKDPEVKSSFEQRVEETGSIKGAVTDFLVDMGLDTIFGALSAAPASAGTMAVGVRDYGNMMQNIANNAQASSQNIEGNSDYEQSVKAQMDQYAQNPTRYLADNMPVNNEEDRQRKAEVMKLAEKEARGEQLKAGEKLFIQQALSESYESEEQAIKEGKVPETRNDSMVPVEFRDKVSNWSEDEARTALAKAAKAGDTEAFVDAMQMTRNSSNEEVAKNAEQLIDFYSGMARNNGITPEEMGKALYTKKLAYIEGLKGNEIDRNKLTNESALAYNEGRQAYIENRAKTVISSKSSVESALVATNEGNSVKLTGVFDNDGVRTENGESVKVEDLDKTSESAVIKAYQYADNYNNVATKNVFLSNITDNTNIEDYNRDFKRIYDMGLAGVSEENMRKGYSSLTDDQRSFAYLAGLREARLKASNDISEDWGVTRKGTGSVINTAEITDQEALDLCAQIAALTEQDVVITSDNIQKQGNARGGFNKNESTIYVKADNVIAITHELGHYVQTYNSKGYDELRKAVADLYIQELGADKFNERMERYEKLYGGVKGAVEGVTNSADRMSVEMFNDSISAMFSTKESAQKLADYLAGNYDPKQAKSLGQKAAGMVKRLANTIRRLTGSEEAKNTTYAADTFEIADKLAERADDFLIALDKAVENYKKSHVQENAGDGAMEFSIAENVRNHDYSYDTLIKKDAIAVYDINDYDFENIEYDEKVKAKDVVRVARNNISQFNKDNDLGNNALYNSEIGVTHTGKDPLDHTLAHINQNRINACVYLPVYFKNAVVLNEADGVRKGATNSYVMFGVYNDGENRSLVRMIVNHYENSNASIINSLYAINLKKEEAAPNGAPGFNRLTSSEISIAQLLDFVKEYFPNDLSADVASHLGYTRGKSDVEGLKFSLVEDTQGNDLSEEQQTYFTQSKIRDKNGRLKVMHHGTAAYGFDVFDIKKAKAAGLYGRGFYFSDSDSHAGQYGKTYDVYLNIVNPLSPGSKTITDEQMLKFINAVANDEDYGIENYGQDATPQSVLKSLKGKDDFGMLQDINAACIGDFASALKLFNRINGTTYDGISTPTETVAFYPNQIKDINNKKPTGADSIYFSLTEEDAKDIKKKAKKSKNVDITKDLVAVHNLGAEQLKGILELKGLPSPSIAIIRSGMIHDKYGDISLIFNSDTIDPKVSARNKVYGGDGWTPTFPKVEVKINKKVAESVRDKVHSLLPKEADQALGFDRMDNDYLEDRINSSRGDVVDAVENNAFLKYAYLADNGEKLEIPTRDSRLSDKFSNDDIIEVAKVISEEEAKRRWDGEIKDEAYEEYEKKIREALNRNFEKTHDKDSKFTKKFGKLYQDTLSLYDTDNITRGLLKYYREGVVTEADPYALKDMVNEKVKKDEAGYHKWISDLFDGIIEKKGLRNNKDYFLPSGNRRSWEALHDEYNLENIVRIMNQQNERGEAAFFSQSAIQALSTKKFESLNDIRNAANQLYEESEEAHEARVNAQSERFTKICSEIMDKTESNSFIAFGRASDAIADAIREGKSVKGIDRVLREYRDLNIKDDTAQKIVDLMKDIGENPTGYFEAKPRRAVWLDEIKKAVIPDNVSEDLVKALDDNNIPYEMYRHEDEGMRRDIIAGMDDIMFSLVENSNGKKLTKDQQKYFGKSGITDEQGRLEIMYHGTPQASFTVFDPEYSDDKTSLFFTNNRFVAAGYAGTDEYVDLNNLRGEIHTIEGLKERFEDTGWTVAEEDGQIVIYDIGDPDDPSEPDEVVRENTVEAAYQRWIDKFSWDGEEGEFGGIYPVYLKAENPLVIDAEGYDWEEIYAENLVDDEAKWYHKLNIIKRDENGKLWVDWQEDQEGSGSAVLTDSEFKKKFGEDLYVEMVEKKDSYQENVYVNPNGEWIPSNTRGLSRYAKEHGYDALIVDNLVDTGQYGNGSLESKVVVVFNSNQVKSIYNEHPSEDPDIRYSLVEDSEGRQLTEGQQRYFKDSKVVDDKGRLMVLYHGTESQAFSVFNTPGIWVTPDKELSTEYAGEWNNWRNETEGYGKIRYQTNGLEPEVYGDKYLRMYKVYANVKNPVTLGELNRTLPDDYAGMQMDIFGIKTEEQFDKLYDLVQEHKGEKIWQLTETQEFIDLMKELGYDGMFATENGHKTICVFNSNQLKNINNLNPTSSEDIRYSLVDADEGFMEFEDRKAVNILEQGMEALKNKEVDVAKLRTLAIKLRNEFGSSYDVKTFTENLQKAFAYMQTEDHVDYQTMMGILRDIARPVIEASNEKIGEQEYKDFISNFKGMKIKLTAKQKEEVKYEFGSYGAFRNAMMPITISDNGETTLDQIWDELVEQSGYMLDRDAVEGDMPAKLLDVLQALRPTVQNTYGGDMEDVAKDLAMRIVEEYIEGESAKQMKAEISEYRQKLKNEYNERLRNLKGKANAEVLARNKRRTEAAKERQLERDLRHDIKLSANKLLTWVSKPTEGKSVPHDMMMPVMQFLQAIDFVDPIITFEDGKYRTKVFDRVDYEDGRKRFIYKDIVGDTRADVLKQFNEAIGRGEGTKEQRTWASRMEGIKDLYDKVASDSDFEDNSMDMLLQGLDTQGLLEDFKDLLRRNKDSLSMNHLNSKDLTLINNIIKNIFHAVNQGNKAYSSNADIVDLAQSTIRDAEGKELKSRGKYSEGLFKMLRLDNVTPRTFFKLLGKRGIEVYKFLRGGLNQEIRDLKKASEFMTKAMEGIDAKTWTGRNATVHEFAVSDGTIRLTDAQILGLYFTIRRNGGMDRISDGIVPDDIKVKGKPIIQSKIKLTQADIAKIESVLTPEQIELGKKMQKYMASDCSAMGNETSMKLYGYKKFTDDTYYPWTVDKTTVPTNNTSENIPMFTGIERSGFTKQLKEGAKNPLVIRDIFDVFTDHVAQMAAYHGYAASVKDTLRWMNYKDREAGTTAKQAIQKLTGSKQGIGYITTLLLDINKANKSQYIGNFTDALIGNYKAAAVGANLRVVAQQPTAYFRALNMIDAKYLMTVNPATAIKNIKRSQEECPISWWKSKGYYETNLGQPIKEIVTGIATNSEKIKDAMMAPAGWADDFTWGFLYTAVEKEQRAKYKGQKITPEQFRKAVNDRFDEMIDNTQVVDSTLHRSQYMRSTDRLNKLQTAFMAEPTKSYNMLLEAAIEDMNEGRTMKRSRRAVTAFLLSTLATSAAAAVVDAMRKTHDDDDWWDVWLKNLKENMADNMNPFNLLPVVKDVSAAIYNLFMGESTFGQSGNRFDIEAITTVTNAAQALSKWIEGDSTKTLYGNIMTIIAKPFSQITGIPAYNAIKDTVALYNTFFDNIETTLNSNSTVKNEKKKDFIKDVNRERSEETLDEGIQDALEAGVSIYDLKGAVQSEYKNKYFDAYSDGDMEEAQKIGEKAARAYARMGLTDEEIDEIINGWKDEVITYSNLDKAIAKGEGIEEEIRHVQEGKDDDKIIKHIMDRFTQTVAYEDTHNIESDWRGNVEKALQAVDPTLDFDSAHEEALQKAAEKEAEAAEKAHKAEMKNEFFDAVEKKDGVAGRKALETMKAEGVEAKTVKTAVSTRYHDIWKEAQTPAEKSKAKSDWKSAYTLVNNVYGVNSKDLDKTWDDWEKKQ